MLITHCSSLLPDLAVLTHLSLSLSLSLSLCVCVFLENCLGLSSAYFFKFTHRLQTSSKLLTSSDSFAGLPPPPPPHPFCFDWQLDQLFFGFSHYH